MRAPCTLTEAVLIVGLCLFAIGSARAVVSAHQEEEADRIAINRVDAQCPDAPRVDRVTRMEGNASSGFWATHKTALG